MGKKGPPVQEKKRLHQKKENLRVGGKREQKKKDRVRGPKKINQQAAYPWEAGKLYLSRNKFKEGFKRTLGRKGKSLPGTKITHQSGGTP